jgi:hypothetical protein
VYHTHEVHEFHQRRDGKFVLCSLEPPVLVLFIPTLALIVDWILRILMDYIDMIGFK